MSFQLASPATLDHLTVDVINRIAVYLSLSGQVALSNASRACRVAVALTNWDAIPDAAFDEYNAKRDPVCTVAFRHWRMVASVIPRQFLPTLQRHAALDTFNARMAFLVSESLWTKILVQRPCYGMRLLEMTTVCLCSGDLNEFRIDFGKHIDSVIQTIAVYQPRASKRYCEFLKQISLAITDCCIAGRRHVRENRALFAAIRRDLANGSCDTVKRRYPK